MRKNNSYFKYDHDAYAKTRAPDDFWGQIRRTVQGKPVSDEQIKMIVDVINKSLYLKKSDALLDIACGNGALSRYFFGTCGAYLGIDFSKYLISIAKANFEALPHYQFIHQEMVEYLRIEPLPERFSKVLCYGSFSYFSNSAATEVLQTLFDKFQNVRYIFIGNLPDKDKSVQFYKKQPNFDELEDNLSPIGIWRTRNEFELLAKNAGWQVKFTTMPLGFYASHYRYDALLSR